MSASAYSEKVYRAAMLEPVAGLLRDLGRPWTEALIAAGVAPVELMSPSLRVSIDQLLEFCQQALGMAREPAFAVDAGLRFHVTTYGMYGFAILSSPTLRQAMNFAMQHHRLAAPLVEARLVEAADGAAWLFRPIAHPRIVGPLYEFVVQLHVAIFLSLLHDLADDEAAPKFVSLTFRPPDAALQRLRLAVRVGDENGLHFAAAVLDRPNRMGSAAVHRMLIEICDGELDQLKRREGLSGRVRELLVENAGRPIPIRRLADRLRLPERSLRRRLADENTSVTELQDELRLQLAIGLLRDTRLNLDDIAAALGFSEAASFRRAFRRWTRMTPSAFRAGAIRDRIGKRA